MELQNEGQQADQVEAPVTEASSEGVHESAEGSGEQQEAPKYEPNYKFRVMDEEKEFDEFLRGAVTQKEHEEKLRDLYTKAHGLEANKRTLDTYKQKVETHYRPLEDKYTQTMNNISYLDQAVQKKDYQTFFDTLKIPKQDILKYALDLVQYEELPADQKAMIDRQRETERNNEMLSYQTQTYQTQAQEYAIELRTMQLNNELMRPEVNSFVQNFDTKAGKPGAFRDQVIRHANLAFYQSQGAVDMPVGQAVQEVMGLYGNLVAQQAPQTTQTPSIQAMQRPPVIPNIQSSGNSPAKKMPRSIADLKKIAKQRQSEQE